MAEVPEDLARLIAGHLDDALDASASERLFALLQQDDGARRLLVSAAIQASVLPRVALESGLVATKPSVSVRRPLRSGWSLAAASLLMGIGLWYAMHEPSTSDVRVTPQTDLVVVRDGDRTTTQSWIQAGDRLEVGASGTRLDWTSEGTGIDLDAGAQVVVEHLGRHKQLRLERGALTAEVAPQGDGGLSIQTPFGVVEVVGTRFRVQVDAMSCAVQVEHGAVRVRSTQDPTPMTVAAGFAVRLAADGHRTAPAPLGIEPTDQSPAAQPPAVSSLVRLGAEHFRSGDGWEGDLVDGMIRGRRVDGSRVIRITTPVRRPDGITRWDAHLQCHLDVTVDQATTLAVLFVCDHPDGGSRWLANIQAERAVPAGQQRVSFTAKDFQLTTPGSLPPSGSRIVAVAVMTWQSATDLRLRVIELGR